MPDKVIVVRSIGSTIRFHCADERLAAKLSYLAATPEMDLTNDAVANVRTFKDDSGFYDFQAPYGGSPGTTSHLLMRGHVLLRRILIDEAGSAPVVHCASLVVSGKRILVVADKGAGKTTLSLKSLASGLTVEGDEHVAVWDDGVMARPRSLRVKQGTLRQVPELAGRVVKCPAIEDWNGDRIYSFEPATKEVPWRINRGKANFLVFLTSNHGGLTSCDQISKSKAFDRLLKNVYLPDSGRAAALGRLHTLACQTETIEMRLGCLDTAIAYLRALPGL